MAGYLQFAHDRQPRSPRRPEPGEFRRDSGGDDDGVEPLPTGLGHAQVFRYPQIGDVPALVRQDLRGGLVGDRHPGALFRQKAAQGHAGAGQTDYQDILAGAIHDIYRNFKAPNDTSPRMMAMIQKRTMTLGSGQPISSKWWCSGAMRKIRLPLLTLKKPT